MPGRRGGVVLLDTARRIHLERGVRDADVVGRERGADHVHHASAADPFRHGLVVGQHAGHVPDARGFRRSHAAADAAVVGHGRALGALPQRGDGRRRDHGVEDAEPHVAQLAERDGCVVSGVHAARIRGGEMLRWWIRAAAGAGAERDGAEPPRGASGPSHCGRARPSLEGPGAGPRLVHATTADFRFFMFPRGAKIAKSRRESRGWLLRVGVQGRRFPRRKRPRRGFISITRPSAGIHFRLLNCHTRRRGFPLDLFLGRQGVHLTNAQSFSRPTSLLLWLRPLPH